MVTQSVMVPKHSGPSFARPSHKPQSRWSAQYLENERIEGAYHRALYRLEKMKRGMA